MKPLSISLLTISIILVFMLETGIVLSEPLRDSTQDTIEGIWLGELEIPNTAKLRMGIIISKTSDNFYKAFLNIIDQATGNIPCDEVIYKNDSVIIKIKELGIEIASAITPGYKSIKGKYRQRGGVIPVFFTRVEKLPELLRPQEPKKPYPYNEENIVFENKKAGIKLAGTLTFPNSKGKFPAVILVTGSGQQDRNENIGGHKPFWIIADYLTRNGIAVLRVDDRGIGGSTGNFNQSTTGDFAEDALAGITFLKSRREIDQIKIGIIGHSEGGIVAPLAASMSSDVAFIVSMAGVFINFEDVVIDQILNQQKLLGRNDENLELERNWRKKIYNLAKENTDSATAAIKLWNLYSELTEDEIKKLNWPKGRHEAQIKQVLNPWWRYVLALDNKAVLMRVKCPVLVIYGELDQQVNPDKNIPIIEKALKEGGNKNFMVKELPGLNHLFQTAETGSEYEYIRIEETFSPQALQLITDWILKQTMPIRK
jgi:pimeloyl-ACP methyl ester carboxylesterase